MQIEPMTGIHADAVVAIYQAGIDEGNATFETRAPCWAEFTARRLPARSYVATSHGHGPGLGRHLSGFRPMRVHRRHRALRLCQPSRPRSRGRATAPASFITRRGSRDLDHPVQHLPRDTASLALHHAAGFRDVGTGERIARHHGRWRDTILIERRKPSTLS